MPAEGTAAKTAIAPRRLNEQLRSATRLSPCHDPARWPNHCKLHPPIAGLGCSRAYPCKVARGTQNAGAMPPKADMTFDKISGAASDRLMSATWDEPAELVDSQIAAQAAACGTRR